MNRRSILLSLLAGVAGFKAVKAGAVSLPATAVEPMLPIATGEAGFFGGVSTFPAATTLQAELMAVQIYNQSPLRSLMGETVTLSALSALPARFDWGDYGEEYMRKDEEL